MGNNDLALIIEEAEGWIGRLKVLQEKHGARPQEATGPACGFRFSNHTLHPIGGLVSFVEGASIKIPATTMQPDPATGYTAVDMATAAAEGFRDGQASVVVELPQGPMHIDGHTPFVEGTINGFNLGLDQCRAAIIAAGGKVKE